MLFSVSDVTFAAKKQKLSKAAGPDGIHMEAFLYGSHRLYVYLTMLFNHFAKFGYVPSDFCHSHIIPIVKNKNDNLSDENNYRTIAISNENEADKYQFRFKKGLSTSTCTYVLKRTVVLLLYRLQ